MEKIFQKEHIWFYILVGLTAIILSYSFIVYKNVHSELSTEGLQSEKIPRIEWMKYDGLSKKLNGAIIDHS